MNRLSSTLIALIAALTAMPLAGCRDDQPPAPSAAADVSSPIKPARQTAFRVRSDFNADLNSDDGWAADINQSASVEADRPFRLRFEVAADKADQDPKRFSLETRRNGGNWQALAAEDFPYPLKMYELPPGNSGERLDEMWRASEGELAQSSWVSDDASGHWRFAAGEQPLLAISRPPIEWQPTEFSLALRLADAARAGVVFAYLDSKNFLRLDLILPNTVQLAQVASGRSSTLAEHSLAFASGDWLEVAIEIAADEVGIEIGDEALAFSHPLPSERPAPALGIHLPAGNSAELRDPVMETEARSPRVSIIRAGGFEHGAPTRDLLPVSDLPFAGGAGVSFAERTPAWSAEGGHGEWSFPIVVRRFADKAAMNEHGDRFDFRLVSADGEPLPAAALASVTLEVPDGHLGGTFVETPMRVGPWQAANGDLYFIMEPSETWNRMMMVKSSDGGRSWREVDGSRRPETGDLEGLGSVFVDGRIHILHQVSEEVLYHAFDTADRPNAADRWAVRDERVAAPPQPPTQVADLAVRASGSIVAVYGHADGLAIATRAAEGGWSETHRIDSPDGAVASGPAIALGADDTVHLAYTAGDRALYRALSPDRSLSDAVAVADDLAVGDEQVGAIAPLVYLPAADAVSVIYRAADGRLYARRMSAGGPAGAPSAVSSMKVAQSPVDSDQVAADAVRHGDAIHVLFVERDSGHLHHAVGRDGRWRDAGPVVTDATVQWVRGKIIKTPAGESIYGFVYDAGSNGGSGMNRFAWLPLE